jgi:branched-chain amino acid transport system substrate-binding protein
MEGVMVIIANWGGKGQELIKTSREAEEPWMTQDSISTYGDIWILKEAMEQAKSADPKNGRGRDALDGGSAAAKYFPGGKLVRGERRRPAPSS